MTYNVDFLISALVFLVMILFHYLEQRKMTHQQSRLFLRFMILALLDTAFDLITTLLIDAQNPELWLLTEMMLGIFYLMQALIPFSLFAYVQSLRQLSTEKYRAICRTAKIPIVIMIVLILINHWTHQLFTVTRDGFYIHGPLYFLMYAYTALYILALLIDSFIHIREYGIRNFSVIWEFLTIAIAAVSVQAFDSRILMTSFGIALGILVLYLTINNPFSYTDTLTGLYDRTYLASVLEPLLKHKKPIFCLELNIRDMRQLNHVWGNDAVNQLLADTAKWILQLSKGNQLFRIGDSKFLILCLSPESYVEARDFLGNYADVISTFSTGHIKPWYSLTGVVRCDSVQDTDDLLSYLDYLDQLNPANQTGDIVQSDEQTMKSYRYQQEIEKYLDTAIEQDLFSVVYQPIWSTEENRYVAVEALSRLHHPTLGPVSPEIFLGLAEKQNRIATIACLQFRRVCRFVKAHEDVMKTLNNVKFNLSPIELMDKDHIERMLAIIDEYGLEPSYFQFEITETAATEYSQGLKDLIEVFTKKGIGLCLDDFGSGYANLNSVLKLPFSVIKLDKSLLSGISKDGKIALFYQNILSLLQKMDYDVVAEGVENEVELNLLTVYGVKMIQGYYFSRPLSGEDLPAKLRR